MLTSPAKKPRVLPSLDPKTVEDLSSLVKSCSSGEPTHDGCRLVNVKKNSRLSENQKGYVQIKAVNRSDPKVTTNTKAQLHQVIAWQHPDPEKRAGFREVIVEGKLELSHLCPNKNCANADHIVAESSWTNKTRWGCPVVIYINNKEHPCCRHQPACIPSDGLRKDALRYTTE